MNERQRETHEAIGLATVTAVVDDFYDRIQRHPSLAEPFQRVHDWPAHKARLTHFWWLSLGGDAYRDDQYRVAPLHTSLGVPPELVDDWLALFGQVLAERLEPELAEAWYRRAENMGRSIRMMIAYGKGQPEVTLGYKA